MVAALLSASASNSIFAEEAVAGATLKIEIRQPVEAEKAAEIIAWVRAAAGNVNQAYGRFPNPSPRIVVIPSSVGRWGEPGWGQCLARNGSKPSPREAPGACEWPTRGRSLPKASRA